MAAPRYLVTGGSGFIGSHLVEAIAAAGGEALNLDLKPPSEESRRSSWREADLLDAGTVARLVEEFRPDAILNLAAIADIALRLDQMPVNTIGLRNLMNAARLIEPRPRIVHVSTQLVARPGHEQADPRDYAPYSEYGRSKADSEEILWTEGEGLDWTILRPTNVWGPRHPSFPDSTWKYLNRRWYMLPKGVNPVRSYGYVANVVSQMLAAASAEAGRVHGRVFYVGDEPIPSAGWLDSFSRALTGRPTRRVPGGLIRLLAELGEAVKRLGGPAPVDRGRLFRLTTDYRVPMAPTMATLGAGPVSLDEGVAETVAWLRRHLPDEYGGGGRRETRPG